MKLSKTLKGSLITALMPLIPWLLGFGFIFFLAYRYLIPLFDKIKNTSVADLSGVEVTNPLLDDISPDSVVEDALDSLFFADDDDKSNIIKVYYNQFFTSVNSWDGLDSDVMDNLMNKISDDDFVLLYNYSLSKGHDLISIMQDETLFIYTPFIEDSLKKKLNEKFALVGDSKLFDTTF